MIAMPAPADVLPRIAFTAKVRAEIAQRAAEFIRRRYRMDAHAAERLAALPIRWRRGGGRSAFYRRACCGFSGPHILLSIPRGSVARWHTYRRVRARWSTPPGGIELPVDLLMTVVLIHEYTHAVQHGVCGGAPRRYSEVETTENELEFVRSQVPSAFAALMPVEAAVRSRRVKARRTGAGALALRLLRGIVVRYQAARAAARPATAPLAHAH